MPPPSSSSPTRPDRAGIVDIVVFMVIAVGLAGGIIGIIGGGIVGVVIVGVVIVGGGIVSVVVSGADIVASVIGIVDSVGDVTLRKWDLRGLSRALMRRACCWAAGPVSGDALAGAAWQVMRVAAGLMPRAAAGRWLAEAESFLFEAPAVYRRSAMRSYLITAPQLIAVSWAGALARRARVTSGGQADKPDDGSGDPRG